jgi:hypothetical protein
MKSIFCRILPYLRIVLTLTFIFVVCFKTTTVVMTAFESKKDLSASNKLSLSDDEKTEPDGKSEKDNEAVMLQAIASHPTLLYVTIKHNTAYYIHYSTGVYQQINIPPPDFNLRPQA